MRSRARAIEAADPAWTLERERAPARRRRSTDRRPTPAGVRVADADLGFPFEAFDLSGDGVFLQTDLLLSEGDVLLLEIARDPGPGITVSAEVVDVVADPDEGRGGPGAGVRAAFRDLSIAERESLAALSAG